MGEYGLVSAVSLRFHVKHTTRGLPQRMNDPRGHVLI